MCTTTNVCQNTTKCCTWNQFFFHYLERFSFERQKVIGFAITMPHDWLKKLAPHFHPIRSKTKTNRNSLARVFPRFASATCNYYEFWLVYCNVYGFGDWLEWLLWFWFYDAQLKTALCWETKQMQKYTPTLSYDLFPLSMLSDPWQLVNHCHHFHQP